MAALRVSQAELAEHLHVSQVMVSKLERMKSVPVLYRQRYTAIAEAKGVELDKSWFDTVPVTRAARAATK